jgi:transcriptional regulator with XRE-family HTH domain
MEDEMRVFMKLSEKIGRKIEGLRAERGWSQTVLGERLGGWSRQAVGRLEEGRNQGPDVLEQLASVFGLDGAEELITLARAIPDLDQAAS